MPVLMFLFVGLIQLALAAAGCIAVFVITIPKRLRKSREKALYAAVLGAAGGFLGLAVGYVLLLMVGGTWKAGEIFHLVDQIPPLLSDILVYLLPAGYVGGLVGGSLYGWRLLNPARL